MFVVGLLTSGAFAQDEGFRFFFDKTGVADNAARPAATALAFTNPSVDGSGRLYLYIGYGTNNQNFSGNNLRIRITGDATFTGGALYNHQCNPVTRWQAVTGGVAPVAGTTDWVINSAFKVGGAGYGARNNDGTGNNGPDTPGAFGPTMSADSHFRSDDGSLNNGLFGTTLLGYIDVAHGASAVDAQVFIGSGDSGSAGVTVGPADIVYFGFGDAGTTNKANRTSATADATIKAIPEPASMALLALGALALRRRK